MSWFHVIKVLNFSHLVCHKSRRRVKTVGDQYICISPRYKIETSSHSEHRRYLVQLTAAVPSELSVMQELSV